MKKYRISVRDLVSFNISSGSIGGSIQTSTRANIGSREHKAIQDSRGSDYLSEYSLKTIIEKDGIILEIFGRADGIYFKENPPIIEEIKTTTVNTTSLKHIAQVKLYAYMYMTECALKGRSLSSIEIKILYINILDRSERIEKQLLLSLELSDFFNEFANRYLDYLLGLKNWEERRDQSLKDLKFPYDLFRPGQREFSIEVFRAVRDGNTLFGRAPTGTGKSIATLFPSLKSMAEGGCSKIFYLTAKSVGRVTARDTLNLIRSKGGKLKSVVLTAKEKICINKEFNCNPDNCDFAKDYYNRVGPILKKIESETDFYENNLKDIGLKYTLCPFELSLDLSNNCDVIICDYNYVFDLRVQLKRFFEGGQQDFTLLIDEAHNLPDRLKNSYSCKIDRLDIPNLIDLLKANYIDLSNILKKIDLLLLDYNKNSSSGLNIFNEVPEELVSLLKKFTLFVESRVINEDFKGKNLVIDWYFNALYFIKLSDLFSDGHKFLIINSGGLGTIVEIYCVDPSYIASKVLSKSKSHIFFSATLTPVNFFTSLILDNRPFNVVDIPSPFNRENLKIIIRDDIKTTYKERNRYFKSVVDTINSVVAEKKGNYMVFFPSYSYMDEVRKLIDRDVHIQKQSMSEDERELYLEKFNSNKNILSFVIMGGVFGEGIDLVGDKLIGVIVVGVGLPQISIYGDLMKNSFNYNYAYTFPGFNKVMQAVGRVIRDDNDRGVVILVDSRFNTPLYKFLFPKEWMGYSVSSSDGDMVLKLREFWNNLSL